MLIEKIKVIGRKVIHPLLCISIEPTNDCNLDCWYCFRKDRSVGYMDIEKYKILMNVLPFTCRNIALSFAGESALHPKIGEFIEIAHKYGYIPAIYTNGTQKYPSGVKLIEYPKPPEFICTNEFKFIKEYQLTPVYEICPEIYSSMNILWNGDAVTCCNDLGGKHIMGNVFNSGLMNVWNNKKYEKLRKIGFCEGCEIYRYKCVPSELVNKHTRITD